MSGNATPSASSTTVDTKVLQAIAAVKADTEAIKARINQVQPPPPDVPRYFPKGYFP